MNIKEVLEACKIIIDALAVAGQTGLSYHPASMIELSGYIAVAIAELEKAEAE